MLLLYLAYFALRLETSDGNENLPASNRARRKKKCDCLTRRCKVIENYTRELLRTPFFTYIPGKITECLLVETEGILFLIMRVFLVSIGFITDPVWFEKKCAC